MQRIRDFLGKTIKRILASKVRVVGASIITGVLLAVMFFMFRGGFVNAISKTWDFLSSADFVFDSNLIETDGSTVRLKAQNYKDDDNTSLLLHNDKAVSGQILDASSHGNNANILGSGASLMPGKFNQALSLNGSGSYLSIPNSNSLALGGNHTIEAWVKLKDDFKAGAPDDQVILDKGDYKLYYNRLTGKLNYEMKDQNAVWKSQATNLFRDYKNSIVVEADGDERYIGLGAVAGSAEVWFYDGTSWSLVGGDGVNGSWVSNYESVQSLLRVNNVLYAGLGTSSGDAEVWSCDTTTGCSSWAKIGGDSVNSSWGSGYESVESMTIYNSQLCAGLGVSAGDAEVWCYDDTTWTKIGGDNLNNSWDATHESVLSMVADGETLYAGLGVSAGDAEVWAYNGTSWSLIGGDGVRSSWTIANGVEEVRSLSILGGNLYAGTGNTTGDADVWKYNGTVWTKIGGDGVNGSWAANTYEIAFSLTNDGTNLYAGLASSDGDGEVWKYDGTNWSQIGGDGVSGSWATAKGDYIYGLDYDGSKLVAGVVDRTSSLSAYDHRAYLWEHNETQWEWVGGDWIRNSWGSFYTAQNVRAYGVLGDDLYIGTAGNEGQSLVLKTNDGVNWQTIGGQGLNNSWPSDAYRVVYDLQGYDGYICAGLGSSAGDAEVWCYDDTTWTKIGGDGLNNSWGSGYEYVGSMVTYNNQLCAGLGSSAGDAEVWCYDDTTWTKIGGDGLNDSFKSPASAVNSMQIYKNDLYVLVANASYRLELWKYNNTTWEKIGGGVNDSWALADVYQSGLAYIARGKFNLLVYNDKLIVGLGDNVGGKATVWAYDGTTWEKIGGGGVASSWDDGKIRFISSLAVSNGKLYAVHSSSAVVAEELWQYDGTSWTRADETVTYVTINTNFSKLIPHKGAIHRFMTVTYADWVLGNTKILSSPQDTWDTNWHHIAVTYNGNTAKLFIDTVEVASKDLAVAVSYTDLPLRIGSGFGGSSGGYFNGQLDELRLSSVVRSSFATKPYVESKPTVTPVAPEHTSGVSRYLSFSVDEATNGGEIKYRLSFDNGGSWRYWDGSSWAKSTSVDQSNKASDIDAHIDTFPVTFSGIKWQAVLISDGQQQVALNSVTIQAEVDDTAPSKNAQNIVAQKVKNGETLPASEDGAPSWTNGASPYFGWDEAVDGGSGILGYCLYLGQNETTDPVTSAGLLADNSSDYAGKCQHLVETNSLNLATAGVVGAPMTTSHQPYYLAIKAIDKAGNISDESQTFKFHFDNTPPSNPAFIYAPSGFVGDKAVTLTWVTNGDQSASDGASGLAGLQYKINNSVWYGKDHTGSGDMGDLLDNNGQYKLLPTPDFDNLNDGINIIYFRTWDKAGNISASTVSAMLKVNTNGAPSEPRGLTVNQETNNTNDFAFSWQTPEAHVGEASNLDYCYSINILPSVNSCKYTGAGVTTLDAGPYATQYGQNTFYLVAKDESGRINYSTYSAVNFYANTTAPGIVDNIDIVDMSIKSSKKWRLAVMWDEPEETGAGIDQYKIYRSTDNVNFTHVGSSKSTTYVDSGIPQETHYFYVLACDSANHCSAESPRVSLYPTGKYTEPAELVSAPQVSDITTKKAKIHWATDRPSDSKIAIGTASGEYGKAEISNSSQETVHQIALDNLAAGTTYYLVAKWTDEDGNTGTSQELVFTTQPAPVVKEINPVKVGLSDATVQFTTVGATKANLYYGETDAFGGVQSINTSSDESTYSMGLTDLKDGTKYDMMVSAFDAEGIEYRGNIFSFTTPSRPKIINLRFQPVEGEPTSTQSVTWTTNVPTSSALSYGKNGTAGTNINLSELQVEHQITIRGLEDDSNYFLIAEGRDANGNLAVSDRQSFKTALDTRPPVISDVNVETSIRGVGVTARGQVIVSWKTDEPSTSQVAYAEGSNVKDHNSRTPEDGQLTTEHIVILSDLRTSSIYSIKPVSYDKTRNLEEGDSQPVVIGRAKESIITIVFTTLQKVFGIW